MIRFSAPQSEACLTALALVGAIGLGVMAFLFPLPAQAAQLIASIVTGLFAVARITTSAPAPNPPQDPTQIPQ